MIDLQIEPSIDLSICTDDSNYV